MGAETHHSVFERARLAALLEVLETAGAELHARCAVELANLLVRRFFGLELRPLIFGHPRWNILHRKRVTVAPSTGYGHGSCSSASKGIRNVDGHTGRGNLGTC